MTRRKQDSLLDELATMPWPIGLVLGLVAFVACRYVGGIFAPFAWLFLVACWLAALASYVHARERSRLLDTQTGMDSLSRITWREFEMLVGEAFRRRGWQVEETGMGRLGGKDGGIDLIIRKDGRTELVQCKQWRARQVRASVVREMWGLVDHHRADGVNIVCSGDFTPDAAVFAEGKAIELINGARLLELVREVQVARPGRVIDKKMIEPLLSADVSTDDSNSVDRRMHAPACPSCDGVMVRRNNRRTGQSFWGCNSYPSCRGTRVL